MPGSLPVSTILFGLISAFLTIPGFHAAEPVPVPTEASGIPFIGETSPTVSPEVPPEEGRIVFIENTALPSGQTAEPMALVGAAALATGRPVFLKYDYRQQQQYTGS